MILRNGQNVPPLVISINRKKGHKPRRCGLTELVREPSSALGAAAGEYLPSVSRLHSLAETMLLLALELFRLIGPDHRKPLLSGKTLQGISIAYPRL